MDWELRTLLLLSSGRNWWVGWMPFVLLAGHLASNSWPALHSSKIFNKKSNRHSKAILEQRCLYNMCPSCFILLHFSPAWVQWGIYGDRLVCQADLKKLRQLTEKISKQMYLDQLVAECVNGRGWPGVPIQYWHSERGAAAFFSLVTWKWLLTPNDPDATWNLNIDEYGRGII